MTSPVRNSNSFSHRPYESPPIIQSTETLNLTPTTPILLDNDPTLQQTAEADQTNTRSSCSDFRGEEQELSEETPLLRNRISPIYSPTSPIDLSRRQNSVSPSSRQRP